MSRPTPLPNRPRAITRKLFAGAALLLIFAVVCVYGRTLGNSFICIDDQANIDRNPWFLLGDSQAFARFWQGPFLALYIPVIYSIWFGVAKIAHLPTPLADPNLGSVEFSALPFHLLNVLTHTGNTLWVFLLLRLLLCHGPTPASNEQPDRKSTIITPLLGALLWSLHPLQAEAVCWATGFKDLGSSFFGLAALWFYLRSVTAPGASSGKMLAAGLAFLLALLSKPSMVTLPVLALVLETLWLQKSPIAALRRLVPALVPALALAAATQSGQMMESRIYNPLATRPVIAADALAFYLSKFVWPAPLALDYGRTPTFVLNNGQYGWALLLVAAISALAIWNWRRGVRGPAVVWLFFLVALLPVQGWLTFSFQISSTTADRYAYMATFALALGAGILVARHRVVALPLLAVTLLFAGLSFRRAGDWQNAETLCRRDLQVNPRSALLLANLAAVEGQRGNIAEARKFALLALEQDPGSQSAYSNLQSALGRQNQGHTIATVLEPLVKRAGETPDALYLLVMANLETGHRAKAGEIIQRILAEKPDHMVTLYQLALIYKANHRYAEADNLLETVAGSQTNIAPVLFHLGDNAMRRGDTVKAEDLLRRSLALSPIDNPALGNLARLLENRGQVQQALTFYERAARFSPHSALAQAELGRAHLAAGDAAAAIGPLQSAVRLQPAFVTARQQLGQALLAGGDARGAVRVLQQLVGETPDSAPVLGDLALAQEQTGDWRGARRSWEKALLIQNFPPARVKLGNVLARLGDRAGARKQYEMALKQDASFAPARQALQSWHVATGAGKVARGAVPAAKS